MFWSDVTTEEGDDAFESEGDFGGDVLEDNDDGGACGGRPSLGLSASLASSRKYAGLQSAQALNSNLSELSTFLPTLTSTVLLEGLELILNGPVQ